MRHLTYRPLAALAAAALAAAGCEPGAWSGEGDACMSCHEGIEQGHGNIAEGDCTICHGGNPDSTTKEAAHVPIPGDWSEIRGSLPPAPEGFIKDFAPDQLDRIDVAYLRFINPGDMRVVAETCGTCHPDEARNQPNSIMTTNAGHYMPTLFLAGIQEDRLARFGSFPATDPDCDTSIPGTVCEVVTLPPPDEQEAIDAIAAAKAGDPEPLLKVANEHYLSKNCNTCHQGGYPKNDSPGLYRSTGCTACHMVYNTLGDYTGGDPTIARGSPVHPARHEITKRIPVNQCATCHFQGGRIGLLYQGIREGGFGSSFTPPNGEIVDETLYAHTPGYYFVDEDTTNSVDETPPDLHHEAGMVCGDCHVGSDVHGDGRIYTTSKQQIDLRCEDCHGTVRDRVVEEADGFVHTSKGRPLPQLSFRENGEVVLTRLMDGEELTVPQPADLLGPGGEGTAAMHEAMAPNDDDWSHTDALTCDTCHTSYTQVCVGCHVSLDMRLSQTDYQTGTKTRGLTRGSRTGYTLDHLLLGTAPDGRVQTVQASQQVQMAVYGDSDFGSEEGELLIGAVIDDGNGGTKTVGEFRHTGGLAANNGFVPFFQHTASRVPRPCDDCHRNADTPEEEARIKGVIGYGTGEFMLDAPDGTQVDGLQYLNADGTQSTIWVHEGTGPVLPEVEERILSVLVDASPN